MNKLEELNFRRNLAMEFIRLLADDKEDPRASVALEEYRRQLESIDKQIEEITGKPPPVVVGLKTAKLFGRVTK